MCKWALLPHVSKACKAHRNIIVLQHSKPFKIVTNIKLINKGD